jgi:hypothetical protein
MAFKRKSERAESANDVTATPSKRVRSNVAGTPSSSAAAASVVSAHHHAGADRRGPH